MRSRAFGSRGNKSSYLCGSKVGWSCRLAEGGPQTGAVYAAYCDSLVRNGSRGCLSAAEETNQVTYVAVRSDGVVGWLRVDRRQVPFMRHIATLWLGMDQEAVSRQPRKQIKLLMWQ